MELQITIFEYSSMTTQVLQLSVLMKDLNCEHSDVTVSRMTGS